MATTKNTDTAADEIPRGFNLVAAHLRDITGVLNAIEQQMVERNDLLRGSAEAGDARAPVATIADADVLARLDALEGAMSAIPGKMDDLTVLVRSIATMVHAPAPTALQADVGARVDSLLAGARAEAMKDAPPNGAAKAIAGRIIEHTVAQVQAQAGVVPGTEVAPAKRGRGRPADPKKCAHPEDKIDLLESGLRRCTRCGTVLEAAVTTSSAEKVAAAVSTALDAGRTDVAQAIVEKVIAGPPVVMSDETAKALATKAVEAVKEKLAERIEAEKAPAPAKRREPVYRPIDGKFVEVDPDTLEPITKDEPGVDKNEVEAVAHMEAQAQQPEPVKATLDDVRAVAIGYAGKHGKEKLGAVLVKYGAGNLSSVPAEKYDALMAELQAS
jgi:hypothetical protein